MFPFFFFRRVRSIRLLSAEKEAMDQVVHQFVRNTPVRLQADLRHPLRMQWIDTLFTARFLRRARKVRLTATEREEMKDALRRHMQMSPATPAESITSLLRFFTPLTLVPVSTFVLLLAVVGVAYAAEGALPGDALYSMKILVNENIADAMSFTPEAQARQGTKQAVRRLDEAITLASREQLNAERAEILRQAFVTQAERVRERVLSLQRRGLDETALEVLSTFEVSLRAHGTVLADIVMEEASLTETAQELLAVMDKEAEDIALSRSDAAAGLVEDGQTMSEVVESTRRATEVHLKQARATAGDLRQRLPSTDISRMEAGMDGAEAGLHESAARLKGGASLEALGAAADSLRMAEEADLRLSAERDKVGRARAIPDEHLNFIPDQPRELRKRTEVHEERLRIRQERQEQRRGE